MSHEAIRGLHRFSCDTCGQAIESSAREFNEALAEAKSDGWKAYSLGGMWFHACSESCRERAR